MVSDNLNYLYFKIQYNKYLLKFVSCLTLVIRICWTRGFTSVFDPRVVESLEMGHQSKFKS